MTWATTPAMPGGWMMASARATPRSAPPPKAHEEALLAAVLGSRASLDAFIRAHRKKLALTDDEVFLLHLRRRTQSRVDS